MSGLLGFTLADLTGAVDSRKRQYSNLVRGLLSDPGVTLAQLSAQDAEAAKRNRYTQMSAGSVMPEVAQQGQEAMLNAALNVGGLLGTAKLYDYAAMYRPPTATNMPAGIAKITPGTGEHKFGVVSYERPLKSAELEKFELVPLDPSHPVNIKKLYESFHSKFLNEFSKDGVYEVKGKGVVTESARPEAPFQFTYIKDGVPLGHEAFTDFDELSKFVWGMSRP